MRGSPWLGAPFWCCCDPDKQNNGDLCFCDGFPLSGTWTIDNPTYYWDYPLANYYHQRENGTRTLSLVYGEGDRIGGCFYRTNDYYVPGYDGLDYFFRPIQIPGFWAHDEVWFDGPVVMPSGWIVRILTTQTPHGTGTNVPPIQWITVPWQADFAWAIGLEKTYSLPEVDMWGNAWPDQYVGSFTFSEDVVEC